MTQENPFDGAEVISSYTLADALADGVVVEVFKEQWQRLNGGRPIVATASVVNDLTGLTIVSIWNEYIHWKMHVEPGLKEEDRLFSTKRHGHTVWVIDDGTAITILYPEDY